MDDLIEAMIDHFRKDDIRTRFETCSEFSMVEQWFRMEIYIFIRKRPEWSVLLVEGPYCTRVPVKHDWTRTWQERLKWCDLVAMGPASVYWFELKALWYRPSTWKSNLNSALKDLLALAGMDAEYTAQAWREESRDTASYHGLLEPHANRVRKGPNQRYSICLLQAVPGFLLDANDPKSIVSSSRRYLADRRRRVHLVLDPASGKARPHPDPGAGAKASAAGVLPEVFEIGWVDRGKLFPEGDSRGKLAIAVWKVP